jgi:hypothetical protein
MNTTNTEQKPGLFTAIALMTMVSGIINLFWGFIASATALGTFVGIVCLPVTILPTILGVFEIIYAAKLLSAQPQPAQPSQTLAVFEIFTFVFGNIFSMVVGILALIFYNDVTVKEYFSRINGAVVITPIPATPAPVEQTEEVSAPVEIVEPAISEPVEPAAPEPVEDPVKPKRIRKVAGK